MLHHISLGVSDLERSAAFYDAALSALGYARVWVDETAVGYGKPGGEDEFAIKLAPTGDKLSAPGFHIAFAAPSAEAVRRFHEAALGHGGECDGEPGERPAYGDYYYAAFVSDPDGHRIEAVINGAG